MTRQIKRIIASVMALVLILSMVSVGSVAAEKKPLLTIGDINSRQGEEVMLSISFAQAVTKTQNRINALDLSLKYDKDVFEVLSVSKGSGLVASLKLLEEGNLGVDTGGYIYSENTKTAGEIRWSLSCIEGFTFVKDSVFSIIRVKIKNASNLENNPAFTISVTNAASLNADKKTYTDRTNEFASYTNKSTIAINLATLCDWEYDSATDSYTLAKFHDTKATYFTIPDTYNDGVHGEKPVRSIKNSAFKYNTRLEKIVLGENIKNIETAAFYGCEKLKLVEVYTTDAVIGANAFYGSSSNFLIRCIKNSTMDAYAKKNNFNIEYFGDIKKCTIEGADSEKYYTGSPVTMNNLKITDIEGQVLTEGIDYTTEYANNINLGTAKLTIKGAGSYFGSVALTFKIVCPYHKAGSEYFARTETYEDCEAGGKAVEHCSFCGFTKEIDLAPKAHGKCDWKVITDPTCSAEGLKAYMCADCNKHINEEAIEKLPHDYEWVTTKEATCQETGEKRNVCKVCGDVKETKTTEKTDHKKEWVVTKEATCTEDGEKVLKCVFCGVVYETETIPNGGGHKESSDWVVTKEATCTETGTKELICTVCGYAFNTETIPAKGHTSEEVIVKEPTCTTNGRKTIICKDCGTTLKIEAIPAPGHNVPGSWTNISLPTCTTVGIQARICTVCGEKVETREKGALGHLPDNKWTTTHEATCTEPGLKVKLCTREGCGATVAEEEIPAKGHTSTGVKTIKEPDCTHTGEKADYCPVCKKNFNSVTIPAEGHTPGSWEIAVKPTCTEGGFRQKTCTKCHEAVLTEPLAAKGHTKVYEVVTAPTYKYTGTERLVCSECKKDLGETRVIPRVYPDIDGDGKFSANDALMILQHATQFRVLSAEKQKSADCNGDRRINSYDALIVLQLSTGELRY